MAEREVLIIGGGVIGLTTAYYLARDGVRVEVIDRSDFGQESSWAGAGILPPGPTSATMSPPAQLLALSANIFPELSADLMEQTGIDNGYFRCGGLEIVGGQRESTENEWRPEGVVFQLLQDEALIAAEPVLNPAIQRAYFLPDMAQVRNPRHLKALIAACSMLGVRFRPGCALHSFHQDGGRVTAARTSDGALGADRFLLCTGAWSEALLELVGPSPGIRPVRGQIAMLNTGPPLFHHILLHGSRYLVPRPDGRVLIGSTEEEVGFDKRTTAVAIADLLTFAISLVPGLENAPVERCWSGLRPGSPDGLPFLGRVPDMENLFIAAGHYRAGIQLSPGTGLLMKDLLQNKPTRFSLEPFALERGRG